MREEEIFSVFKTDKTKKKVEYHNCLEWCILQGEQISQKDGKCTTNIKQSSWLSFVTLSPELSVSTNVENTGRGCVLSGSHVSTDAPMGMQNLGTDSG